jgi:hypothetical protein
MKIPKSHAEVVTLTNFDKNVMEGDAYAESVTKKETSVT